MRKSGFLLLFTILLSAFTVKAQPDSLQKMAADTSFHQIPEIKTAVIEEEKPPLSKAAIALVSVAIVITSILLYNVRSK